MDSTVLNARVCRRLFCESMCTRRKNLLFSFTAQKKSVYLVAETPDYRVDRANLPILNFFLSVFLLDGNINLLGIAYEGCINCVNSRFHLVPRIVLLVPAEFIY